MRGGEALKAGVTRALIRYMRASWPQKSFLMKFLKASNVDCVIDVGANAGQFAVELRRIGYNGLIISFEPDPEVFGRLQASANGDARWVCKNVALGAEAGVLQLNRMALSLFNSFLAPSTIDTNTFERENKIVEQVDVRVERLDYIWDQLKNEYNFKSVFLKMDTQGFDLKVFEGASGIIDQVVGLQSEMALERLYDGAPDFMTSMAVYRAAGFVVAGLFAVNPELNVVSEIDCYFVPATP